MWESESAGVVVLKMQGRVLIISRPFIFKSPPRAGLREKQADVI